MAFGMKIGGTICPVSDWKVLNKYFNFESLWKEIKRIITTKCDISKDAWLNGFLAVSPEGANLRIIIMDVIDKIVSQAALPPAGILTKGDPVCLDSEGFKQNINSKKAEFFENNESKIQKIIEGVVFSAKEANLLLLFMYLHIWAGNNIKDDGSAEIMNKELKDACFEKLDTKTVTELEVPEAQEEYRIENSVRSNIQNNEAGYKMEIVPIYKKQGNDTTIELGKTKRTVYPGEALYAVRCNGEILGFLPKVRVSKNEYVVLKGDSLAHYRVNENGDAALVNNLTELAKNTKPASWDFDAETGEFIVADSDGAITSVGGLGLKQKSGVIVSCRDGQYAIIGTDGRLWSNDANVSGIHYCKSVCVGDETKFIELDNKEDSEIIRVGEKMSFRKVDMKHAEDIEVLLKKHGINPEEVEEAAASSRLLVYRLEADRNWRHIVL